MATKKKAAAPKAAKTKAVKAPAAAAHAQPKAAGGRGKGAMIALGMLAVLAAIFVQIYVKARHEASLKFDMVRMSRNIVQGLADGQGVSPQALQGDKDDNLFFMEGMGPDPTRLQKFSTQSDFIAKYVPKKVDDLIAGGVDLDVDEEGQPWVLLKSGEIKVLSSDLKRHIKTIATRVPGPTGIGLHPDGRVFVSSMNDNKLVIFNRDGIRQGELGGMAAGKGEKIVTPVRLRVSASGLIAVLELGSSGLHMKVFGADLKLKQQWDVTKVQWCEPVKIGVTVDDKLTFNDQIGGHSLVIYDMKTGNFVGESKGTTDNGLFISPGSSGANKYSKSIYVHSVNGLTHCRLPEGK